MSAPVQTVRDGDERLHLALVDRAVEPTPTPEERARLIDALVELTGSRREPLERARAEFQRRLAVRSDDFEATQGLRMVEGALNLVDRPAGLWAAGSRRRRRRRR